MSFCRGANLRALMQHNRLTGKISQLYEQYITPSKQGTLLSDLNALEATNSISITSEEQGKATRLADDTYAALVARLSPDSKSIFRDAQDLGKIRIKGVSYATTNKAHRDSLVLFRDNSDHNGAGQIVQIFLHSHPGSNGDLVQDYFLVVRPFRPLSSDEMKDDPYLKFPLLDVRLYHQELLAPLVIKASDVVSHVACCPYRNSVPHSKFQVVLSLNRVRE